MSAIFLRPVATYPVRCSAPAFFTRPAYPAVQDVFSLFDDSFAHLEQAQRQARKHFKRPFNPKFDVKESQGAYTVEGELPGFDSQDLSIEFLDDGHTLQIKGRTVKETRKQQTAEGLQTEAAKAVEAVPTTSETEKPVTTSGTSSVKSHQATVEDDVEGSEQPANASAAAEQPVQEQRIAESSAQPAQESQEQSQQSPETKNWITERYTGSFTRSFSFPSKVDQEAVKASLKDGILAITLPFARRPESRKIQIE